MITLARAWSKTKISAQTGRFIFLRVINKRYLGLNNTNSWSKYYMVSPRK